MEPLCVRRITAQRQLTATVRDLRIAVTLAERAAGYSSSFCFRDDPVLYIVYNAVEFS